MVKLKTSISSLFIFLSLLSLPFLLAWKTDVKAETSVIYVDSRNILGPWDGTIEHPYRNITSALKNALDGYTIYVRNGTYVENLLINKSVSLIGEHTDLTIIDGSGNENVVVITAENVTIRNFTVRNSGEDAMNCGILLNYSNRVVVSYNKIIQNTNGISLRFSSNNIVLNNTIFSNVLNGLSLHYSSSNTISYNTITYNINAGIYLLSSSNNMISGNTVLSNYYGIHLTLSGENTIYHNNFNNTQQVYSDTTNSWSYNSEGNYWSEYSGRDLNYDGIGDDPYLVDSTVQDNYPLTGMFSIFYVDFQGKAYAVPFICNSTISNFKFEVATETADRMIIFNVTGKESTTGFCRIVILTELMNYSLIVTIDNEEVQPNLLSPSNETHRFLYVNYTFSTHTIKIISSKTMYLYTQLLGNYAQLQSDFDSLNASYYEFLDNYTILSENYSYLQEIYNQLNNAFLEHLSAYNESIRNFQNLVYIFAATIAIFLLITVYLSKRAHVSASIKKKVEEEQLT
ncbi:MAG: NosD domain-containing protein [Candidatus Bathyarchaeia archaeon]